MKSFFKYTSAGNDFLVFDAFSTEGSREVAGLGDVDIPGVCHRRFGVGADGVIVLSKATNSLQDFRFHIQNSDGSTPAMCGNGLRAAVHFFHHHVSSNPKNHYRVETAHGSWSASVTEKGIGLQGPVPALVQPTRPSPWEGSWYNSGVPHFVKQEKHLREMGHFEDVAQAIRNFEGFPEGTNVSFFDQKHTLVEEGKHPLASLYVRTFERGVEGETMACGTGVLACAFHAYQLGAGEQIEAETPGGQFVCHFQDERFELFGPTECLFKGELLF